MKDVRHAIQQNLIKEFDRLLYPSMAFFKDNLENYFRVSFETIAIKQIPFRLDPGSIIDFMLDSKTDIEKTTLDYKLGDGSYWGHSEIRYPFSFKIPMLPEWGSPEYDKYREWRDELEYTCQEEFWDAGDPIAGTKFHINIFDDRIFEKDKFSNYENARKFLYNKKNWLEFVASLVEKYFPEYKYSTAFSSKKISRYLLEIKENIWFGFEYDQSEVVTELGHGYLVLPDYFNLIILTPNFKRTENVLNYYVKAHEAITSLGILGNPFFYHPCYPLQGYSAVDSARSERVGTPYLKHIVQVKDGYQIIHPEAYANSMKKHAIFYMNVLSATSRIYLDYLKVVLMTAF